MRRTGARSERLVRDVAHVCARAQDPLDLLERVAALVRRAVPYQGAGWILVDPDTMLMNGVYAEGVDRQTHLALIEAEMSEAKDVARFIDLATASSHAAALSVATRGDLASSYRWRTVYAPRGYGDELRANFTSGSTTWGHACLARRTDDPFFTGAEVELVARLCPFVADGIRAGLVVTGPAAPEPVEAPGLVVLRDDGSVESTTPSAAEWFGDVEDETLRTTIVLHQVARRVRALADGRDPEPAPARAWARTRSGESVIVRGARLAGDGPGRTVLVLDPASRADLAPLLMELHSLTPREREVTRLLLTGRPSRQIAAELWITPETLRWHVKNVLAKLEVSSRAELFALLSRELRSRSRPPSQLPRIPGDPRTRHVAHEVQARCGRPAASLAREPVTIGRAIGPMSGAGNP